MTTTTKQCMRCDQDRPIEEFKKKGSFCAGCRETIKLLNSPRVVAHQQKMEEAEAKAKRLAAYKKYNDNPRALVRRREYSWKRQGIRIASGAVFTQVDFDRIFYAQGSCCATCGAGTSGKKGFHVDHDHKTGRARGILCQNCNHTLGLLGDSPEKIAGFLNYLTKLDTI